MEEEALAFSLPYEENVRVIAADRTKKNFEPMNLYVTPWNMNTHTTEDIIKRESQKQYLQILIDYLKKKTKQTFK